MTPADYLRRGEHNVIAVDWSVPAGGWYAGAQTRTKATGEIIGSFIEFLVSEGAALSTIHCVGENN